MSPPRKTSRVVVPAQTAQVAHAAFPGGTPYIVLRTRSVRCSPRTISPTSTRCEANRVTPHGAWLW